MSNFRGGNRSSRGSNRSSMHDATCSSCGKDCQVPFRPTGSRPIFCSICFDKQGGGGSEKNFDKPRFGDKRKREFERENTIAENKNAEHLKSEFARLHAKLDSIMEILGSRSVRVNQEDMLSEETLEKVPFKMRKKVSTLKKTSKKK